jgi:integrase
MPANTSKKSRKNEREATKYEGVYQRVFYDQKHEGKPVISFTIDYYHPQTGKRVRETVGRSDRNNMSAKLASKIRHSRLERLEAEAIQGFVPQSEKDIPTLGIAWERYHKDWLIAHKKPREYNDNSLYKTHLAKHDLHNRRLGQITVRDLEKLSAQKRDAGLAPQTVVHILGLIRRVMNRAIKWKDWSGPTPFNEFEMPTVDNERTRFLTEKDARILLDKLQKRNTRAWLMSLLAVQCGLRFGEIAKLAKLDVDFDKNLIFIRKPKNTHSRYACMPASLKDALANWLFVNSTESPLVFPSSVGTVLFDIDEDFKEVIDEMKLNEGVTETRDRFSFHCLRHTFASYLASEGYSISNIADMLGQRSTKMARRYTHLLPGTHRAAAMHIDRMLNGAHLEIQP